MRVILQFPIADLRSLSADPPAPFSQFKPPREPLSSGKVQSLRYFGWADRAPRGADQAFPDEKCFYSSHHALSFPGLGKTSLEKAGVEIERELSLQRKLFITDTGVCVRFEVDFLFEVKHQPLSFLALVKLLDTILQIPTRIERVARFNYKEQGNSALREIAGERPLLEQRKHLASHFVLATSDWAQGVPRVATKLVKHCLPMVLVEFQHGEFVTRELAHNIPVFTLLHRKHTADVDAWFGQLRAPNLMKVPCWLITPGSAKAETVRSYRLCLLRLSAEHQALREALNWIDENPETTLSADAVAGYLNYVQKKVLWRSDRAKLQQSAIMSAITAASAMWPEEDNPKFNERIDSVLQRTAGRAAHSHQAPKLDENWKDWLQELGNLPDLTIAIQKLDPDASDLFWSFSSPHAVNLPSEPLQTSPGRSSDFQRFFFDTIRNNTGKSAIFEAVRDSTRRIGAATPPELWGLIAVIADKVQRSPTILLLSDEQYIPWELARDPRSKTSTVLAAEAVVARWILPTAMIEPGWPPTEMRIDCGTLIFGDYKTSPLPNARPEVEEICAQLEGILGAGRLSKISANYKDVLDTLRKDAEGHRILHFATHGTFNPGRPDDGLRLSDKDNSSSAGVYLDRAAIAGQELRGTPFVFLNSCQLGMGLSTLNTSAGMAESFVAAGAGAVVGPLWNIDDAMARRIAVAFYKDAISNNGAPLVAELLRTQRASFSRESLSPTCLAYKFLGHPELRLRP